MKYAITVSALVPVKQFLVIEAGSKEEAVKALEESVDDSVKNTLTILSVEEISEEDFNDILNNDEIEEIDPQPRSLK